MIGMLLFPVLVPLPNTDPASSPSVFRQPTTLDLLLFVKLVQRLLLSTILASLEAFTRIK
jgi:hypothetical protein